MLNKPEYVPPWLTHNERKRRDTELADCPELSTFKVQGQLLSQGRTETILAATDQLTARLKIYASGGEVAMHSHEAEDHCFIVLKGSARFHGADEDHADLGELEGIMIPRGQGYRFTSTSDEPLVVLRFGTLNYKDYNYRRDRIKHETDDQRAERKVPVVYRESEYFG